MDAHVQSLELRLHVNVHVTNAIIMPSAKLARMSLNHSNSTDCFKFDKKQIIAALVAKATIGSLAFVGCLLVILSVVWFKGHKRFVYRLTVYFMTANLLQSFAQVFGVISVDYDYEEEIATVREGWETACVAFGFIDQVSMWMSNCAIIWIVLYLLSSIYRLFHVQYQRLNIQNKGFGIWEVCGLFSIILIPVALNWIPFLWNMYGFAGLFCWIKQVSENDCSDRQLSTKLMFTLSYGPLLFLLLCGFLSLFILNAILLWSVYMKAYDDDHSPLIVKKVLQPARRVTAIVVLILIVYSFQFAITVANRLYSITHPNDYPVYPLWLVHAVVSPSQLLIFLFVAFALHIWKTFTEFRQKHKEQRNEKSLSSTHADSIVRYGTDQGSNAGTCQSTASFIVPPELDDIEEQLVIRGEASCETSYTSAV